MWGWVAFTKKTAMENDIENLLVDCARIISYMMIMFYKYRIMFSVGTKTNAARVCAFSTKK